MNIYIIFRQNVCCRATNIVFDDLGLFALDAMRFSKEYVVKELKPEIIEQIVSIFEEENGDFMYDDCEVIVA